MITVAKGIKAHFAAPCNGLHEDFEQSVRPFFCQVTFILVHGWIWRRKRQMYRDSGDEQERSIHL